MTVTTTTRSGSVSDLELYQLQLAARSIDPMIRFYTEVMGMSVIDQEHNTYRLGFRDKHPLLELVHEPSAMPRPAQSPGLFHVAWLYPDRSSLATALQKFIDHGWPLDGAADHGVSEALYLADPEGNGIELYADRPREQWAQRNGQLEMVTDPLDLPALMAQKNASGEQDDPCIGHVHLQVSSLPEAEDFWCRKLGLDATQRSYPGALFVSAGGYHHHIGLNTWRSGGKALPPGVWTGLRSLSILIPAGHEFLGARSRFAEDSGGENAPFVTTFETTRIIVQPRAHTTQ